MSPPASGAERPRALDRVRKLLALASSPNPHEAALAAARAQALIEAHRLQRWLEAEAQVERDPDPIVDARDQPLETGRKIRPWKAMLATVLAEANGCVAYTGNLDRQEALVLVGRARDREVVVELWTWLVRRIEWLSATHGAGQPRKWHEAFRMGVVDAVAERLAGVAQAVKDELETAALVVVEPAAAAHQEALRTFVDEHLRLGRGRSLRVDAEAWEDGRLASASLPLPRSKG